MMMNPMTSILPIAGNVAVQAISRLGNSLPFAQIIQGGANDPQRAGSPAESTALRIDPETRIQYEAMLQNIRRMRDELHEKIEAELQQRGVNLDEPIAVTVDGDGRLLESSGSWDRAEIEQMLEENQALAHELRELFRHVQTLRRMGLSVHGQPADTEPTPVRLWMEDDRAAIQILS
jgi:hypothetical protein